MTKRSKTKTYREWLNSLDNEVWFNLFTQDLLKDEYERYLIVYTREEKIANILEEKKKKGKLNESTKKKYRRD